MVIDPGELFGAGTHPTTQLCLELLLELEPEGALCDWGAGSGILAVTAARLGFAPVDAVEVMPGRARGDRAQRGRQRRRVRTHVADLAAAPAPWAPTVDGEPDAGPARRRSPPGGLERPPERMIASGVLAGRADAVADAFARHGLVEAERRVQGEWAAVLSPADVGEQGAR